jgi:hypothetical protein
LNVMPGVEILDVFLKYTFRIAIGHAFSFQDVRQNIEQILCSDLNFGKNTIYNIGDTIKNDLSKSKHWAMYILPTGQVNIIKDSRKSEAFNEKLNIYSTSQTLIGGKLLSSEDVLAYNALDG